ncbi:sensor histidine kinase [Actinomadura montaniterrae]|uniref:histidine kinase n=1 Tax=Actinomadura montaniterrae TaxID=1803903 RepID=A0A6L3VWS8_9ACTN|nr:ATP-binding protein [Actinomadura montaniterrae]KAB2375058.1 HAMP domain-containing protein [Actinomadura montaniterrae]
MTLVAVATALLLSTALYAALLAIMRSQAQTDLLQHLAHQGRRVVAAADAGRLDAYPFSSTRTLQQVVDQNGRVVAATPGMQGRPPVPIPHPNPVDDRLTTRACGIDVPGGSCFTIVEFRVRNDTQTLYVLTLAPEVPLVARPAAAAFLGLLIPLTAAFAGWGAWATASRALRPAAAIRRELDEITATDLGRRVPVEPRDDEVTKLATSINATLDRLERAVARQRAFVSDVSHELRSPLTGLRVELEFALTEPDDADLHQALQGVLSNTDRLGAVVADLLALARLDAGKGFPREEIDLAELAEQEIRRRPRRSHFDLIRDGPVRVVGGPSELARLLTNLIDNADRHAAEAVAVRVHHAPATATRSAAAVVEVVDDGVGVAAEDRERVFERFTRLADARHRDAGGTGLGLAISRDIAEAHHGTLTVTGRLDDRPGARFVLRLPVHDPPLSPAR